MAPRCGPGSRGLAPRLPEDLVLELYNEAGQLVLAYHLYRCWVSEYQALPTLDATGNAVAIESITLQYEGFERDASVTEPVEPSSGVAPAGGAPEEA